MKIVAEEVHCCAAGWNADHYSSARIELETVISRSAFCDLALSLIGSWG
jgi:hypothetical protein